MKEDICKKSFRRRKFPNNINLGSIFITSTDSKAENLNNCFTEIGQNLTNIVSTPFANFDTYLNNRCHIFQPENTLSINKLGVLFTHGNLTRPQVMTTLVPIKQCFGTLNRPLHYICNISLQLRLFPEEMKIARVTLMFKAGEDIFYLLEYTRFHKNSTKTTRIKNS